MKEKKKRKVDLVVISDVHLGTYGCKAKELHKYLKSIKPKTLVLNGDIVDIWQFSKRYWPKSHMKVVKHILGIASKGTRVFYIPGNHDETIRKFAGMRIGDLEIVNQLELDLNGEKTWIFHGDVFDVIMQHSKWLARLGAIGYDGLILLNVFINKISRLFGGGKISLSQRIKENVKSAVKFINNFEETAATLAIQKEYKYVVCGHIHHPEIKTIEDAKGNSIVYLNSGDWVENLTSLEYHKGVWSLYSYSETEQFEDKATENNQAEVSIDDMENKEIFRLMVKEFKN